MRDALLPLGEVVLCARSSLDRCRFAETARWGAFSASWLPIYSRCGTKRDRSGFRTFETEDGGIASQIGLEAPAGREDGSVKPAPKGRVLHGLIVAENIDSVDFMELRRPPGRPMFLVMFWRYPQDKIEEIVRLPEPDRQQLAQRIEDFKNREKTEPDFAIDLQRVEEGPTTIWHCEIATMLPADTGASGKLIVDSTAEEETTRRSILRIEQIFSAYSEILPPRRTRPAAPLHIKLFGAMPQYQSCLAGLGLSVENPAVFVPSQNLLVAGSELSAYAEQLEGTFCKRA